MKRLNSIKTTSIGTALLAAGMCFYVANITVADSSMEKPPKTGAASGERTGASSTAQGSLSKWEQNFIEKAAADNVAEVQFARLAKERGELSSVKDFAQRVMDDRSKENSQLVALGSRNGITLPEIASTSGSPATGTTGASGSYNPPESSPSSPESQAKSAIGSVAKDQLNTQDQEYQRLSKLSGSEFDKAYIRHEIDQHKKAIQDYERAANEAKDSELKNFASNTLPTLRNHLRMAQDLQQQPDRRM